MISDVLFETPREHPRLLSRRTLRRARTLGRHRGCRSRNGKAAAFPWYDISPSGTAREAAAGFPANVNVAAALAMAGIGPDRTMMEIWADPSVDSD
jgi:hypothetical protein